MVRPTNWTGPRKPGSTPVTPAKTCINSAANRSSTQLGVPTIGHFQPLRFETYLTDRGRPNRPISPLSKSVIALTRLPAKVSTTSSMP